MVDKIYERLSEIVDPELGVNLVDLGLIYDVSIEGNKAKITYTLTSLGCPAAELLQKQIKESLVDGIDEIETELVFTPVWTPHMITDEGKWELDMYF